MIVLSLSEIYTLSLNDLVHDKRTVTTVKAAMITVIEI